MKLILTLSLICTLFCSVEMLQCFKCIGEECTNSSLVNCPAISNKTCLTANLRAKGLINVTTVVKGCSPTSNCGSPLNNGTTVSVNQGFSYTAFNLLCCNTDGCNNQTQPAPNSLANGRQCPSCSSFQDTVCNSTVACLGVEDQCFSGSVTLGSTNITTVNLKGCTTSNMCNSIDQLLPSVNQLLPSVNQLLPSVNQLLPSVIIMSAITAVNFTCKTAPATVTTAPVTVTTAPVTVTTARVTATAWSIRLSLVPLLLGLTISKLI
ncbi:phospholipase A2 inhibitor and Ly6/PLAUR domain-containing protein [Salmo salar]|uniref:Phospholipase A2 inhibitor and Ly6/PLAUR domain-containing protein n=1 Tax=Salmo salar TaxID=8030 RepID=A0A1S3MNQ7_SALSA|nr:phospholipase A2 inhibitor and Ly6/PLAUR domain-containing protein-like [Salmo salar]|eukprot:XP_014004853.1 PREDICTED: phospholipase A2 inhibitor and Ly6/PLAUR domain-containing protein-like [Salmo salar]